MGEDRNRLALGIQFVFSNTIQHLEWATDRNTSPAGTTRHEVAGTAGQRIADHRFIGVFEWDGRSPDYRAQGDYAAVSSPRQLARRPGGIPVLLRYKSSGSLMLAGCPHSRNTEDSRRDSAQAPGALLTTAGIRSAPSAAGRNESDRDRSASSMPRPNLPAEADAQRRFGAPEFWGGFVTREAGDCEDYALERVSRATADRREAGADAIRRLLPWSRRLRQKKDLHLCPAVRS